MTTDRFDTEPLERPVDRAAVRAYTAAHGRPISISGVVGSVATAVVILAGLAVLALLVFSVIAAAAGWDGAVAPAAWMLGVVVVVLALVTTRDVIAAYRRAPAEEWRLATFAEANGMSFTRTRADPPYPGLLFEQGTARETHRMLRRDGERTVEFGDYEHTVGTGKSRMRLRWGYVAIRLHEPMPHLVLDSARNDDTAMFLGTRVGASQRLSLEGDFDRSFRLYSPKGYERDALYLFTPDVMALFVDSATPFDVEIVDDRMLLFTRPTLITTDPARWRDLARVLTAVTAKVDRWERWRDDRAEAGPGLDGGRRLRP